MTVTPIFTENSRTIFDKRYPRKDAEGNPAESPSEAIHRVASNIASVTVLYNMPEQDVLFADERDDGSPLEFPLRTAARQQAWLAQYDPAFTVGASAVDLEELWHANREEVERVTVMYEDLIATWDFLPNSPTWTGAGTPLGQLAACFVLAIDDDLGKHSPDSIMDTLRNAALIQQTGGGNGFSFSRLRPKRSLIKTSMGQASGPVGFMVMYDAAFGVIAQGGSRRGANMAVLNVTHPDIRDFIHCKSEEGDIENFNISVAITDEFMECVETGEQFFPRFGNEVYDPIDARKLLDEIAEASWRNGEPGTLFIDTANRDNPRPHRGELESTNPCGEQWLLPGESCCLGSLNLANFVDWGQPFDWDRLANRITEATYFLDDVIDANQFVPAVPQLEVEAQGGRRIGLGFMGLADAMIKMGVAYDSEEGLVFAAQVAEWFRYWTMRASIERAAERGAFPDITGSIYDPDLLKELGFGAEYEYGTLWAPPKSIIPYTYDFGRPPVDWNDICEGMLEYGIRNSAQNTVAPTGTISNVAGLEGSGCECVFALAFLRELTQDEEKVKLFYLSHLFDHAMSDAGFTEEQRAEVAAKVKANGGSCQGIDEVPEELQRIFVTAGDITAEDHVWMQGVIQAFVDNSISKTINLPNNATVDDVKRAIKLAHQIGCKGLTVYRQGSREKEVLSTSEVKSPEGKQAAWPTLSPIAVPDYAKEIGLPGRVYPVETAFGKMQAVITELEGHPGRPFDVRLSVGKAGNDKLADVEALGRAVSLALRTGTDVKYVIEQLQGIGGQTVSGFGDGRVLSVADGLGKLLDRLYADADTGGITNEKTKLDPYQTCPLCLNASLVVADGCARCEPRMGGCGQYEGCS